MLLGEAKLAEFALHVGIARLNLMAAVRVCDHGNVFSATDLFGNVCGRRVGDEINPLVFNAELLKHLLGSAAVAAPIGAKHANGCVVVLAHVHQYRRGKSVLACKIECCQFLVR